MIGALVLSAVIAMPAGWRDQPTDNPPGSTVEMLQIGVGPAIDGFSQTINVLRHRLTSVPASMKEWAAQSTAILSSQPDASVNDSHAQRECNTTIDGWEIESTGTYRGRKLILVQAAILDGGYEYVATYTRPENTTADPIALKALETLCPLTQGDANAGNH